MCLFMSHITLVWISFSTSFTYVPVWRYELDKAKSFGNFFMLRLKLLKVELSWYGIDNVDVYKDNGELQIHDEKNKWMCWGRRNELRDVLNKKVNYNA